MRTLVLLAAALALASPAFADGVPSMMTAPAAVPAAAKDVGGAGRWRLRHTDGSSFVITLNADGSATSSARARPVPGAARAAACTRSGPTAGTT